MTARIIDISVPISATTLSWQDRYPVRVDWHSRTDAGDPTTNSTWLLHAHTGTHLDAPRHHLPGSPTVDGLELSDLIGRCRVLDLRGVTGIGAAELAAVRPQPGERLLLRTDNSTRGLLDAGNFADDYVGLLADGADYLARAGVRLVGADFLTIEQPGAVDAPAHHALLGAGVHVLEGLTLGAVPPGTYELLFLPLPLTGAEAAPGRAVLIDPAPSEEEC